MIIIPFSLSLCIYIYTYTYTYIYIYKCTIIKGSLVLKLPSYRRMSRGSLVTMSSSCEHHHVNNKVSKSSSRVGAVEESNSSGACDFTGENTFRCGIHCFPLSIVRVETLASVRPCLQ